MSIRKTKRGLSLNSKCLESHYTLLHIINEIAEKTYYPLPTYHNEMLLNRQKIITFASKGDNYMKPISSLNCLCEDSLFYERIKTLQISLVIISFIHCIPHNTLLTDRIS